jgi:NAD(P)H dehydrogenase (quinone)
MQIGVSGASGKLGRKVLERLSQLGGHRLVGISCSPETTPAPIEGRRGDYDEPASLVSAYQRLDRLLLIPSADLRPGVRGGQLTAAVDAANKAGVSHVVLMSAAGTKEGPEDSIGGAYWAGEQHLIKTTRHWTILRMNYYAESMAEEIQMSLGMNVLPGLGDERVAYVSRDDLADAAAGVLLGDGHAGAIYNGTGPAIIDGPGRAAIVSDVVGKPLSYAAITADQLRAGLSRRACPSSSSRPSSRSRRHSCRVPSTF